MYVVRTTKSSGKEIPSVDIQFHPNEEETLIEKQKPQNKGNTEYNRSHVNPRNPKASRSVSQNESIAYLLKDLNIPFHKLLPEKSIKTEDKPISQLYHPLPLNKDLKNNQFNDYNEESPVTISNERAKLHEKSSERKIDAAAIRNICGSFEDVTNTTNKQYESVSSNDTVHHIIELSGNENVHFDSSLFENTPCANDNEETVDRRNFTKDGLSNVSIQVNRNVPYPMEPVRSKYDSSLSKVSKIKRFTAEEIASMGKTGLELVYNYSGKMKPFLLKQYGKESSQEGKEKTNTNVDSDNGNDAKESSQEKKEETDNFVDNDNGVCSGCEKLEPSTRKRDTNTGKEIHECGICDETDEALANEMGSSCNSCTSVKKSSLPINNNERIKINKFRQNSFSKATEKDETGGLRDCDKDFGSDSADEIGKDLSDIQQDYWDGICKCFHYGNKTVIKIAPILKSMIKGRVCVIEIEVEDFLSVGKIKKIGGALGKEIYCFTVEDHTEEDTIKDTQLPKSSKKSPCAKSSKLKRKSVAMETIRSKNQIIKFKNKKSKICESDIGKNSGSVKDNISTELQDSDMKVEIVDPNFENTEMIDHNAGNDVYMGEDTSLSDHESHRHKETFDKECCEGPDDNFTDNSMSDIEIKSEEVYEYNRSEMVSSRKQCSPIDKDKETAKRKDVNEDKVTPRDRLTELKEMYLKKNKKDLQEEINAQSDKLDDKGVIIKGGKKQEGIIAIEKYTVKTNTEGTKVYNCNFCEYTTSSYENVQVHVIDHKYMCEICGSVFKHKFSFYRHKQIHADVYQYTCQLCEKGFNSKSSCIRHFKRHIGLKIHACKYCDKSFVTSSELKRHIHGQGCEKPYKCDICGRSYGDSSTLNQHVLTHTQTLRFMCGLTECNSSFTRKDRCVKHIKKVHSNNADACVIRVFVNEPLKVNKK